MQDRVADVLAQRSRLDRGAGTAVALSLLLHGAIAGTGTYLALRQPPPISAPAINIRFAPTAPAAQKASGRKSMETKPAPATPVAPPKPAVPRIEAPKPEPVTPATAPVEKNTAPTSAFGRSTKRGSEAPPVPTPRPAAPSTTLAGTASAPGVATTAAEVPVGGSGVTGLEGGDFPYTVYIERMKTLIGQRWIRPPVAGATTTVYFVINRDGSLRDWKVQAPSGSGSFDRAALRAVMESSPLPPLPYGYNGTYLGVHLTFK